MHNISLIGIGYWGKVHLKYLKKIKNVEIKSIFFKKNKKILKDKEVSKFNLTDNLQNVLNDNDVKFVDIVTPIDTHSELVLKFLRKKKKILVEKPLIMSQQEKKEILQLDKKNQLLTVSYPYLFSKSLNSVKKIISSKKLGSLEYIDINIQQCGRFMKYGVDHLLAPHALSILSIFFNIDKVSFDVKSIIKIKDKKETSLILCRIKKKLICTINLSLNNASSNTKKFIFYCKNGTIICDLNNSKYTVQSFIYKRIKKKNFTVGKIIKFKNFFFNEKNNMKYVIQNFFKKQNGNKKNFNLTDKINLFLKKN